MGATALVAAPVPQRDTAVVVPQPPGQRVPGHRGRAEPAQTVAGLHHVP